jgi:hypothetical protein
MLRREQDGRTSVAANGKGRHRQVPMMSDIANLRIV